jgi:hypothetical protein
MLSGKQALLCQLVMQVNGCGHDNGVEFLIVDQVIELFGGGNRWVKFLHVLKPFLFGVAHLFHPALRK